MPRVQTVVPQQATEAMTAEPMLSVCIPTYNREPFLAQAIESVLSQMGDDVEIVISDNASTDGTEEMVKTYQVRHPAVAYYRNPANVGYDKNVLLAIERARGQYVWLMGSDDLLNPGAVDSFRLALRDRPDLVLAWVNVETRDRELEVQTLDRFWRGRRNLYFRDPNRLLWKLGDQLSFMSSLILRRDVAMACLPEVEPFIGGGWVHLVLTLLVAKRGPMAIVAHVGLVKRLNYSPDDYPWFGTLAVSLNACFRQAARWGYSRYMILWIMNWVLLAGPIWRQIWHLKANRKPGLREARRLLMREYRWFPAFWLLVYPTFWVPAPLAVAIRGGLRLKRSLVKRVAAASQALRPSRCFAGERRKACSICGNGSLTVVHRDAEFDVYRCRNCGTLQSGYQSPDMTEEYDAAYFRDFETHYKEYRLKQYKRVLPILAQATPGRRLLDVGCALGYFVEEAGRNGWDAAGIDISAAAIAYASEERRVPNLVCGDFEEHPLSPDSFDAVTFWDVLEHMRHPREALSRARDLLIDDGILVVKVPSTSGLILKSVLLMSLLSGKRIDKVKPHFREHLFYFTPQSLRYLLESAGFEILCLRRQAEHLIIFNDHRPTTLAKVSIKHLLSLPEIVIPGVRSEILLIARKTWNGSGAKFEPERISEGACRASC